MNELSPSLRPAVIAQSSSVVVTLIAPAARFSLRAGSNHLLPITEALGIDLPTKIGKRSTSGDREALCLGPDEWTVLCPEDSREKLKGAMESIYQTCPHSFVDVSDRELSVRIQGENAKELLTIGCPRDIDSIAVGEGRRTIFDGVSVILWRDAASVFRLDAWRSFAPHVHELLIVGCRELEFED